MDERNEDERMLSFAIGIVGMVVLLLILLGGILTLVITADATTDGSVAGTASDPIVAVTPDVTEPAAQPVVPVETEAPEPTADAAALSGELVSDQMVLSGSVGSPVDAAAIARAFQTALSPDLTVLEQFVVETNVALDGGTIVLTGEAASDASRTDIADRARSVAADLGLSFDNQLTVAAGPSTLEQLNTLFADGGVNFASGSAELTPESTEVLDEAARLLRSDVALTVEIRGHTDDQGSAGSNQQLSEARAQAVSDYLTDAGVASERITGVVGVGEAEPIADNGTAEGRAQNRRIEFVAVEG